MSVTEIFHQKVTLEHQGGVRRAIFEMIAWRVPRSKDYPEGIKYRAWLSVYEVEIGYLFRGFDELIRDIRAMIEKEGFIYEK